MLRTILLTTTILLVLQACNTGTNRANKTMPTWVLSPPPDTKEAIFGIGNGYSYNDAKEAALKEITSKLMVKISSQSKTEVSLHNDSVSRSANQQINTHTVETQLSNYEVLNSEQLGNEVFVQVSMSRPGFIKITSSRLKEIDDKIKSAMQGLSRKTRLQQLVVVQEHLPSISDARTLVLLLQTVGGTQNTDEYLSSYNDIHKKSQALLQKVHFNIDSSTKLQGFAKHLLALLHNENISASISKNKKADAYIYIDGKINSSVMFAQYIANIKTTIKISDKKKRTTSVREYESSGSSLSNSKDAVGSAIRSLGSAFKTNGVLASLGLIKNK